MQEKPSPRKYPNFLDRSALLLLSRLHIEIPFIAELEVTKQYLADMFRFLTKTTAASV